MDDWNDFRLVLAIARHGTLKKAAAELGHDHSTVFRGLNSIEKQIGTRLFERDAGQYRLTPAGERMVAAAERIEIETIALSHEIFGSDARLSGQLRITSSETIAYRILIKVLAEFRRVHLGIDIEVMVDNRQLDLSKREADIAIRATRPIDGNLFGRKIADVAWTLYAAAGYLESHPHLVGLRQIEGQEMIGWDATSDAAAAKWIDRTFMQASIVYRSSSLINQLMAAKTGIGMVALPCYLGDLESDISRLHDPIPELSRELWLITHKDLKHTARVRAFFEIVGAALLSHRDLLEGRKHPAAPVECTNSIQQMPRN